MADLITLLRQLNRKERYYLVAQALGIREFRLGDDFRGQLAAVVGREIPQDAFVAMDYHLNWLHALRRVT